MSDENSREIVYVDTTRYGTFFRVLGIPNPFFLSSSRVLAVGERVGISRSTPSNLGYGRVERVEEMVYLCPKGKITGMYAAPPEVEPTTRNRTELSDVVLH